MKIKRLLPIVLVAVILLSAAAYTVFIVPLKEKDIPRYTEAAVIRGDMKIGITESGYLEYEVHSINYDLDLNMEADDQEEDSDEEVQKYLTIQEVYVAQGQQVQEGAPLLKFSEESITQVRRSLENALAEKRVEYNEAENEYRLAALEAENSLQMQQTAAKYAENIYQASSSAIDDEITILQLQIQHDTEQTAELEEAVTETAEEYQEAKATYEEKLVAYEATGLENTANYLAMRNIYESARSAYERALSALEQAQSQLEDNTAQIAEAREQLSWLSAKKRIQKLEAEQEYEETIISGENAVYSYEATLENLAEDLKAAQEDKKALEEKLADFEALVGKEGILYAPKTGRIAEVFYRAGDTLERAGSLFSYITAEDMTLSVDVTQEDVVNLAVGDRVSIEFAAYEGQEYTGIIDSIDTTATSEDTPTISYTVVVGVEGTLEKLFGGMSADITFITDTRENTLYITRKALVEENGKTWVYVNNHLGEKELREVTTGVSSESSVEILSGLEEGDRIFIVTYVKASQ